MKAIFSIPLSFLLINMAIIFALSCKKEPSPLKEPSLLSGNTLLSCSVEVGGKSYDVAISSSEATGTLSLPYGSDLSTMKVVAITVFYKARASLSAGSSITVSDKTFTIAITAEDSSVNNYTITIVIGFNAEAEITAFSFEKANNTQLLADVVTTIAKDTIRATLPYGTNLTNLIPTFTLSYGATVKVKDLEQSSGKSKQDFASAVKYVVTAQDGTTTKTYVVKVLESFFVSFTFQKAKNTTLKESGDITFNLTANYTQANVEYIGQDSFVPTFTVPTGAKVYVNDVEQNSGVTKQSFLNTVTYKVVAQNGDVRTQKIAINYTSTDFKVTTGGAISGSNTALTTAVIGEYMNGVRVTEIAGRGFKRYYSLTKLKLPNSLEYIGDYAFGNCRGLSGDLTIPSSVTSIGEHAFHGCTGFKGSIIFTFPSLLVSIGHSAFSSCMGFSGDLTIPSSVTSIGGAAFWWGSGFTGTLTIPSSVTFIGKHAFVFCKFKRVCNNSLAIPGRWAFHGVPGNSSGCP